jgi:hypothetical protein
MNELQAQLDEVNAQIAEEQAKGPQKDADVLAGLEQKQAVILMQLDDAKLQEEQQVRIQAQEEKVESIVLPYDFDDIFENKSANEMIIELLKEYKRKDYEEHNAEIQQLIAEHKNHVSTLQAIVTTIKQQNAELQGENTALSLHSSDLGDMLEAEKVAHSETKLRVNEIETNRSNAVKQLEEAQAEIAQLKSWNDDLRAQAAQGVRKAIDVIDISPSEKLALMVKETNEQKANRGLARWAEMMPEVVAPPVVSAGPAVFQPGDTQADDTAHQLDETGFIPIPADHQEVAAPVTFPVQSGDAVDNGLSSENGSQAETVTRQEFEALKALVKECCDVCNVDIAEVA